MMLGEILPDVLYRRSEYEIWPYGDTQLDELIKTGKIPQPVTIYDGRRAQGWYGRTIIQHQKEREEKAKAKAMEIEAKKQQEEQEKNANQTKHRAPKVEVIARK
jgi:thiamine kinase-like enzyme